MKKPAGILFLLLLNAVVLWLSINPAQAHWSEMTNSSTATLFGVWGSSASNVFAVGEGGTILNYNGAGWSSMGNPGLTINGVWGSSATDVYAVGNCTFRHYDGSSWTDQDLYLYGYNFYGIWGSSATDVYAVGEWSTIMHYNGNSGDDMGFYDPNLLTINGVWGSSATDVYAVGYQNATIRQFDGTNWYFGATDTPDLYAVWGTAADDVFAVGDNATILQYNGSTWSPMARNTTVQLRGIWGSSGSDVFAVGLYATILHYDGGSWGDMTPLSSASLYAVWGSACSDVFAVGEAGTILHYDGELLTVHKDGTGSGTVKSDIAGIDCGSTCSYPFCSGTVVTLTATPDNGSTFTGWNGAGCSGTDTCSVPPLLADSEVWATFTANPTSSTTTSVEPTTTTTSVEPTTTTTSVEPTTTTTSVEPTTTTTSVEPTTTTTSIEPTTTTTSVEPTTTTTSIEPTTTTTSVEPTTTTTSVEPTTTTTSVEPTTTTTVPACSVRIIPKNIGWLIGEKEKIRFLLVIGNRCAAFNASTKVSWNSDAIETLNTRVFLKRFMLMKVRMDGARLDKGDYRVSVGGCTGSVHMVR